MIVGDLHLRASTPRNRTEEDFSEVCLGKMRQVFEIYNRYDCGLLLQPGDFFSSSKPNGKLLADLIMMMRFEDRSCALRCGLNVLTIHGQHDLEYHTETSRKKSSLRVMEASGILHLIDTGSRYEYEDISVYGAGFGQEVPEINPYDKAKYRILVSHVGVAESPLWPGHDPVHPTKYAKAHPGFNLYVFGDDHRPFLVETSDCLLMNSGVLIRQNASEREKAHEPKVIIMRISGFSSGKLEADIFDVFLEISPAEKAFKEDRVVDEEEGRQEISRLVELLKGDRKIGVSFADNLQTYFEKHGTEEEIRKVVWVRWNQNRNIIP